MAYTTFKLPIGYRLYDREQNKVVPLNQEEYESLERIQAGRATQEDGELLERFRSKGFCLRRGALRDRASCFACLGGFAANPVAKDCFAGDQ